MNKIFPEPLCAAYGCPLHGTMTSGQGNRRKWWCSLHYGRDVTRYQAITAEINRLSWLAFAIRDIRALYRAKNWPEVCERIKRDMAMAQRADLQFKGNKNETKNQWLFRLEKEMNTLMEPVLRGNMLKRSLYVQGENCDHFHKITDFSIGDSCESKKLGDDDRRKTGDDLYALTERRIEQDRLRRYARAKKVL